MKIHIELSHHLYTGLELDSIGHAVESMEGDFVTMHLLPFECFLLAARCEHEVEELRCVLKHGDAKEFLTAVWSEIRELRQLISVINERILKHT